MYAQFTVSQQQEVFLQCHDNAFEYFGGIPRKVIIDNLKTGVRRHRRGEAPELNPAYAEFARHDGFEVIACNPRCPQEKGRVENGVGYLKNNFLRGRQINDFAHLGVPLRRWLDEIANVRVHRQTGQQPRALFEREKETLQGLPLHPYDTATVKRLRASSTFRIALDTNRYSVPAPYAGRELEVRLYSNRVLMYHDGNLIAEHIRRYGRHGDFENPDHPRALLAKRRHARQQKELQNFLQLGEHAEVFYLELQKRRLNAQEHVRKILALEEIYSRQGVTEALSDGHQLGAYSSEYIANILQQRARPRETPGPLHLTRPSDLLELDSPVADLSLYDTEESQHG